MDNKQQEIQRALDKYDTLIDEYAKAKSNKDHLEEFKKSKLAMLMNEAEKQGITAANKQESWARSNKEYIDLLEGLKQAIYDEAYVRNKLKKADLWFEFERTWIVNARKQQQAYSAIT